jgi:Ala-tRNA(Pro) deacylase
MTPSPSERLERELERLGIAHVRVDHPAVFTVEQSESVVPPMDGARTKNLFLRDKKGTRHFLLVAAHDKRVDLKRLGEQLQAKGLMLASDERLAKFLGVTPGAVSVLALVNDTGRGVELLVDRDVWSAQAILAHPLVNTATLAIPRAGLERLLQHTGHLPQVIDVPPPAI